MRLAPGKQFSYFTFAFCSEHLIVANVYIAIIVLQSIIHSQKYLIVANVYVVIIVLQSIIHSRKSQDLNTCKTYQQYSNFKMNMYVKQLNSSDTNSTINMRLFLTANGIASIHMLIM